MKTTEMQRYGDHGWSWTEGECDYRTNSWGDGLWQFALDGGVDIARDGTRTSSRAWKQIVGTCDYSLPIDRTRALRRIRYLRSLSADYDY